MDPDTILAELMAIEQSVNRLMAELRPRGVNTLGKPVENAVWWSLSSAQGSVDAAIGRVLRHQQAASEEASDAS